MSRCLPTSLPLPVVLLVLLSLSQGLGDRAAAVEVAVSCVQGQALAPQCKPVPYSGADWTARGVLVEDSIEATGWGSLAIEGRAGADDGTMAFAAGYLEGLVTGNLTQDTWSNLEPFIVQGDDQPLVSAFVSAQLQWVREKVASQTADPYWVQVGLVLQQFDGMTAGYAAADQSLPEAIDLVLLNMVTEVGDIRKKVAPSSRPDFSKMTPKEIERLMFKEDHCSAIVKVTDDLSDLYFSHVTWTTYSAMLRLFKTYTLPFRSVSAKTVRFSGYAGTIPGIDDFYVTSSGLGVMETTNGVYNGDLYDRLSPKTVPYWVRVTVANRMATTARDWHDVFYAYQSGTYNNQWITLDYNLFKPGHPLPANTLWVSEQLPGFHHAEDQTQTLARSFWPSYNVPFYLDVYNMSGYPAMAAKDPSRSYQLAPRAKIFRRDAGAVETVEQLQHFMRFNEFGHNDPLCPTATAAISARGDLLANPLAVGAIDAKITSAGLMKTLEVLAVAGPTTQNQAPFAWTGRWANASGHAGQPQRFAFPWVTL